MAEKTRKSIRVTLYVLLIISGIFLHMLLSDANLDGLIGGIFQSPTGIFTFLGGILGWTLSQIFSVNGLYLFGTAVIIEFVVTPLMTRYKMLTFRTNFLMSVVAAVYVMFLGRVLAVILGI